MPWCAMDSMVAWRIWARLAARVLGMLGWASHSSRPAWQTGDHECTGTPAGSWPALISRRALARSIMPALARVAAM